MTDWENIEDSQPEATSAGAPNPARPQSAKSSVQRPAARLLRRTCPELQLELIEPGYSMNKDNQRFDDYQAGQLVNISAGGANRSAGVTAAQPAPGDLIRNRAGETWNRSQVDGSVKVFAISSARGQARRPPPRLLHPAPAQAPAVTAAVPDLGDATRFDPAFWATSATRRSAPTTMRRREIGIPIAWWLAPCGECGVPPFPERVSPMLSIADELSPLTPCASPDLDGCCADLVVCLPKVDPHRVVQHGHRLPTPRTGPRTFERGALSPASARSCSAIETILVDTADDAGHLVGERRLGVRYASWLEGYPRPLVIVWHPDL